MRCNQICDWNDSSGGCVKPPAGFCPMSNVSAYQKPQTNADRIRAMSDEELAADWVNCSRICDWCSQKEKCDTETVTQEQCVTGVLEWLKQPAEVDGNG